MWKLDEISLYLIHVIFYFFTQFFLKTITYHFLFFRFLLIYFIIIPLWPFYCLIKFTQSTKFQIFELYIQVGQCVEVLLFILTLTDSILLIINNKLTLLTSRVFLLIFNLLIHNKKCSWLREVEIVFKSIDYI